MKRASDVRARVPGGEGAVKGDRVEIVVDAGEGTRTYEVSATRAGRRVEVSTGRGIVEVTEVTRTGTAVRTARFMASRVIALVEHPVDDVLSHSRPDARGRCLPFGSRAGSRVQAPACPLAGVCRSQ